MPGWGEACFAFAFSNQTNLCLLSLSFSIANIGTLTPGRFLCSKLTQVVLLFVYIWWQILIKGFQSTFSCSMDPARRESWSAANRQRSSLIWPRERWDRGVDSSENWAQQTWVSSLFAEKVWPNTVLLVSGSCFSNLSPLGSWRCKPLAALPLNSSWLLPPQRLPVRGSCFAWDLSSQLDVSSWENWSILRTLTYLKVIPLRLETYGFLFQELSVICQETWLRLPLSPPRSLLVSHRMGDHSVEVAPVSAQKVLPHLQALLPFFILTCPK